MRSREIRRAFSWSTGGWSFCGSSSTLCEKSVLWKGPLGAPPFVHHHLHFSLHRSQTCCSTIYHASCSLFAPQKKKKKSQVCGCFRSAPGSFHSCPSIDWLLLSTGDFGIVERVFIFVCIFYSTSLFPPCTALLWSRKSPTTPAPSWPCLRSFREACKCSYYILIYYYILAILSYAYLVLSRFVLVRVKANSFSTRNSLAKNSPKKYFV